jgi:hypothetical protein
VGGGEHDLFAFASRGVAARGSPRPAARAAAGRFLQRTCKGRRSPMKTSFSHLLLGALFASLAACQSTVIDGSNAPVGDGASKGATRVERALRAASTGQSAQAGDACISCLDVVSGVEGAPCDGDGPPSSAELLNALVDCICTSGCATECGDACAGTGDVSDACNTCVSATCAAPIDACVGDGSTSSGGGAGSPPPASCGTCYEVIYGAADPANVCTNDGPPSSQDLLNAFTDCICTSGCATECADACNGTSDASDACYSCIDATCSSAVDACVATGGVVAGDPPGNPPPASCVTCSDLLHTGGEVSALCTDDGPPSSAALYGAFVDCVCTSGCASECGDACNGTSEASDACYSCINAQCADPIEACANQ